MAFFGGQACQRGYNWCEMQCHQVNKISPSCLKKETVSDEVVCRSLEKQFLRWEMVSERFIIKTVKPKGETALGRESLDCDRYLIVKRKERGRKMGHRASAQSGTNIVQLRSPMLVRHAHTQGSPPSSATVWRLQWSKLVLLLRVGYKSTADGQCLLTAPCADKHRNFAWGRLWTAWHSQLGRTWDNKVQRSSDSMP